MKKLNWLNEADISYLAYEASLYCLGSFSIPAEEKESFIYKHQTEMLYNEYYELFENDFQLFSKYAKLLNYEPVREE
jgi:hypothetical protein